MASSELVVRHSLCCDVNDSCAASLHDSTSFWWRHRPKVTSRSDSYMKFCEVHRTMLVFRFSVHDRAVDVIFEDLVYGILLRILVVASRVFRPQNFPKFHVAIIPCPRCTMPMHGCQKSGIYHFSLLILDPSKKSSENGVLEVCLPGNTNLS